METELIFYASCAFLLIVFIISMILAARGNETVRYFLWVWAILLPLALPFVTQTNVISSVVAALMLLCFLYVLYSYSIERVDVSHEETRRVLAELNRRIEEERRILARRLHDEVNPQLLMSRNVLKQIEPLVKDNQQIADLLGKVTSMVNDAYAEIRDIIKNTRIEVIDSIGFTAALESLVAHYSTISEKPAITLEHNLPKRPELAEEATISLYKVIREAVFNTIKHANANTVHIYIQHNKTLNLYKVDITDDGVGVKATARPDGQSGIGLIDMRERVRVLGGTLKIQAADPSNSKRPGTRVSFSFSGQLL